MRGRHPLCGIGVTSLMAVISSPAACRERIAASRPAPGPFTYTLTSFIPCAMDFWAALSDAIWAAKGVLLRDPLKPTLPALAQATTFPAPSVMVTMVLLNVAWMQAMPCVTPLPSFLLGRAGVGRFAGVAIHSSGS